MAAYNFSWHGKLFTNVQLIRVKKGFLVNNRNSPDYSSPFYHSPTKPNFPPHDGDIMHGGMGFRGRPEPGSYWQRDRILFDVGYEQEVLRQGLLKVRYWKNWGEREAFNTWVARNRIFHKKWWDDVSYGTDLSYRHTLRNHTLTIGLDYQRYKDKGDKLFPNERLPFKSTLFAAGLFLVVVACGAPDASPPDQNQLVLAFPAEPAALNPVFLADNTSFTISGWLFNGLTKIQPDLRIAGELAESWQFSPNGHRLTFSLRRGVKWHDGQEFAADDVVFTYRTITSPDIPTPLKSQFGPVRRVTARDRYTVVVDYDEPFGSALESWTVGIVPQHVFQHRAVTDPAYDRSPIGTGPYRLRDWLPGQQLVLESFPDFFLGPPMIQRLIIKIIPDPTTRFFALKTGKVDVMELTPAQYDELKRHPNKWPEFALFRTTASRYGFLGFNHLHPGFRNRQVRQAFSMAINKAAIIQGVFKGLGSPGHSPFPPGTWYSHDQLPDYPYNPTKAKEILKKQAFTPGSAVASGNPLILATNYESKENLLTAQIIQENLQSLGILLKIRTFDWLTFRHLVINKRHFDLVLLERHFLWDPDLYMLWHSSQTKEGAWNFLNYHHPEVDCLLAKARRTLKRSQRRAFYRQVQEIMVLDPPCVFLYNCDAVFLARTTLKGISPSPLGIFYNLPHWHPASP